MFVRSYGTKRRSDKIKTLLILGAIFFVTVLVLNLYFNELYFNEFSVEGKKIWSEYTGKLEFIDVENDICCHCDTRIKLYNQSWIRTYNCDESLENIKLNETYIFYTEPFAEQAASYVGSFWVEVVYRVKDTDNNVVWESHWW